MLIFGINTLCSILSNCTSKKSGIKIYFLMYFIVLSIYVFLCFFDLLVFVVYFSEICRKHFLKHNNAITN